MTPTAPIPTKPDYSDAQAELRDLLDAHPTLVTELLARIRAGRIDGGIYWSIRECGCLYGTLDDINWHQEAEQGSAGSAYNRIEPPQALLGRMTPLEWLVFLVRVDMTPANTPVLALIEGWIVDWLAEHPPAVPPITAASLSGKE